MNNYKLVVVSQDTYNKITSNPDYYKVYLDGEPVSPLNTCERICYNAPKLVTNFY